MRDDYDAPPRFHEPLIMFAAASSVTKRIRLGSGVLMLPSRDPVFLAKQLGTLDRVSGGRVIVGVGTGAYREEFERSHPRMKGGHRGRMLDEGVGLLKKLLSGEPTTHDGDYYAVDGVALNPVPIQDPLPIYMGGNAANVIERAAAGGQGWLPGALPVLALSAGCARPRARREFGRDPEAIDVAPQYMAGWARRARSRSGAFARAACTCTSSRCRAPR